MKARYKIRFHLGAGQNYMKWQVTNTHTGVVSYYDREFTVIEMDNCKLRNRRGIATQIFNGQNKTVCAWIECDDITVHFSKKAIDQLDRSIYRKISYNPRIKPHWSDDQGNDIDNKNFKSLSVIGAGVYGK